MLTIVNVLAILRYRSHTTRLARFAPCSYHTSAKQRYIQRVSSPNSLSASTHLSEYLRCK
jgi:hypothetical protein